MRPFPFSRFALVNFDDRYDQKHCKQHTAIIQWASGPSARFLSFLRRFIAHRQVSRFLFTKQLAQNLHFCLLPSSRKKLADAASCIFFFRCAEPILNDCTVLFPPQCRFGTVAHGWCCSTCPYPHHSDMMNRPLYSPYPPQFRTESNCVHFQQNRQCQGQSGT